MAFFNKIIFTNTGPNAGTLTIWGRENIGDNDEELYSENLTTKHVWLTVGDKKDIGGVGYRGITIYEGTKTIDYKATISFKKAAEVNGGLKKFGQMVFGEVKEQETVKLKKIHTGDSSSEYDVIIGTNDKFALGFIGTDDLRNGKINASVFNIDKKDVYLKIVGLGGDDYNIEIGYIKKP